MRLENLKDFEWYNEPENVLFNDHEMNIVARAQTDFWQSRHHDLAKDNGHFFHQVRYGDFSVEAEYAFEKADAFAQCGLMVRLNAENWFKVSIMTADEKHPEIGTCLTQNGCSDWGIETLSEMPSSVWYKVLRRGADYVAFYSLDGQNYQRLRQFGFWDNPQKVEVGAYFCAPGKTHFASTLRQIDLG